MCTRGILCHHIKLSSPLIEQGPLKLHYNLLLFLSAQEVAMSLCVPWSNPSDLSSLKRTHQRLECTNRTLNCISCSFNPLGKGRMFFLCRDAFKETWEQPVTPLNLGQLLPSMKVHFLNVIFIAGKTFSLLHHTDSSWFYLIYFGLTTTYYFTFRP